jgi:hypothetical protein
MRAGWLILAALSAAFAQRLDTGPRAGSAGDMVTREFDRSAPAIGTLFPAVDIFDAGGRPFNTRSLKGRYTVLVSGCLT